MREFVYVSDAKLAAFLPSGRWAPSLGAKVSVNAPVGAVELTRSGAAEADPVRERARRLRRALKEIGPAAAEGYIGPDLRAGSWFRFRAPLNLVVPDGRFQRLALFLDAAQAAPVRLLLHGSARHLLGAQPIGVDDPSGQGPSFEVTVGAGGGGGGSGGQDYVTTVVRRRVLDALLGGLGEARPQWSARLDLPSATALLVGAVEARMPPVTAAPMTGHARVTARLTHEGTVYVVATPLCVAYDLAATP